MNITCLLLLSISCYTSVSASTIEYPQTERLQFGKVNGSIHQEVGFLILREIYQLIGLEIQNRPMSSKRAFFETNTGRSDGELLRIKGAANIYPSLLRVPTSIYHIQSQMFANEKVLNSFKYDAFWQSYRFAIVRGTLHPQQMVDKYAIKKVHQLNDVNQLLKFVNRGRADIAITGRLNGLRFMQQFSGNTLIKLGEPLNTQPLYHFLHVKHRDLVPKIDAVIRRMKKSGELDQLIERFEQQVLLPSS